MALSGGTFIDGGETITYRAVSNSEGQSWMIVTEYPIAVPYRGDEYEQLLNVLRAVRLYRKAAPPRLK